MNKAPLTVVSGSRITLHFSLSTPDGIQAISTFGESPSEITIGAGELVDGLEASLMGLKVGDRQTLLLEPDQAFGPRDEGKVQKMPRSDFSDEITLEEGLIIEFTAPSGAEVGGIIRAFDDNKVEVDFNHPLAGRDVVFTIEILEITPPMEIA